MNRREFITLLGGVAAWPLAARAQHAKLPTIGFLGLNTPASQSQWTAAFMQRLRELGWIEGRTIAIEYRWAEGRSEHYTRFAAEFVRLKVDVIVTPGAAVVAANQATSIIPIVFPMAGDPVGTGLVVSLARPGGNVTGLSLQRGDLAGKRIELLREVAPALRRLGALVNVGNRGSVLELSEVQTAARTLGLELASFELRGAEDISPAFEAMKGRIDALYITSEPMVHVNRARINTLALSARLPTVYAYREFVEAGSLMSYGPNFADLHRRAATRISLGRGSLRPPVCFGGRFGPSSSGRHGCDLSAGGARSKVRN